MWGGQGPGVTGLEPGVSSGAGVPGELSSSCTGQGQPRAWVCQRSRPVYNSGIFTILELWNEKIPIDIDDAD